MLQLPVFIFTFCGSILIFIASFLINKFSFFSPITKKDQVILQVDDEKESQATGKRIGFTTLKEEIILPTVKINGSIPQWLKGTLIAIGPAKFELGKDRVKYAFHGFGMLHRFSFNGADVSYANKFLQSEYYKKCHKEGKMPLSFCSNKKQSFFSKLKNAFAEPELYDNANLNTFKLGDSYLALTETVTPVLFNPKTLQAHGVFYFKDKLEGHVTSAQPQFDKERNAWFNYMVHFGSLSSYEIFSINNVTKKRNLLASISIKNPAYMRSFGMTKDHIILTQIPYTVNPFNLLFAGGSFLEQFNWKPKQGTTFSLINKKNRQSGASQRGIILYVQSCECF